MNQAYPARILPGLCLQSITYSPRSHDQARVSLCRIISSQQLAYTLCARVADINHGLLDQQGSERLKHLIAFYYRVLVASLPC